MTYGRLMPGHAVTFFLSYVLIMYIHRHVRAKPARKIKHAGSEASENYADTLK